MGATCVGADPACSKSVAKPVPNEVPVEAIEVLVERRACAASQAWYYLTVEPPIKKCTEGQIKGSDPLNRGGVKEDSRL